MRDGPLDMRMNTKDDMDIATWLKKSDTASIVSILKEYGEERYAKRIAHAIVAARDEQDITTTLQLANIVADASPTREPGKHPATRTFQALRIFINEELEELKTCLSACLEILAIGGRLLVISFHSLEDRIVKRFMRDGERGEKIPAGVPVIHSQLQSRLRRIGRGIKAGQSEVDKNVRARSSMLRIAEKTS